MPSLGRVSGIESFRLASEALSGAIERRGRDDLHQVRTPHLRDSFSLRNSTNSVHLDTPKDVLPAWRSSLGRVICRGFRGWFPAQSTYDLLQQDAFMHRIGGLKQDDEARDQGELQLLCYIPYHVNSLSYISDSATTLIRDQFIPLPPLPRVFSS